MKNGRSAGKGKVNPDQINGEDLSETAELLMNLGTEEPCEAGTSILRREHPRWRTLIERGSAEAGTIHHRSRLEERRLVAAYSQSELQSLLRSLKYNYISHQDVPNYVREELQMSTIAWNEDDSMMLLYLKNFVPLREQTRAQRSLDAMIFKDPTRAETKHASDFNATLGPSTVRAGELLFGFTDRGYIQQATPTREQASQYEGLRGILRVLNSCFAVVLPADFARQNRAIPEDFRQFGTAVSTTTILRSAPAALHKDEGNGLGLTVMTTVRGSTRNYTGGTLCLPEYGLAIPVRPGDVLIAATAREWHINLTPVKGIKYSIVAYYRDGLANSLRLVEWRNRK